MKFLYITLFVLFFILFSLFAFINIEQNNIKIGLLYSKTGTMSAEESSIYKAVTFAVEQINQNGGVLNKQIEVIPYDGASDPKEFKKGATELITKYDIDTIFGCWTSSSRKEVKDVVENYNKVLFYPVQYEGVESSKNIIYLGSTPNQQINPTLSYIKQTYGPKVYLVGSDYIYPRIANDYIKALSKYIGLEIIGEQYKILGERNFKKIIDDIEDKKPDVIINTLNGSSNESFFKSLYENNISSSNTPVFSFSLDENSVRDIAKKIDIKTLVGQYGSWNYFNSIKNSENEKLKNDLQKRWGKEFILTDASYSAYMGVKLWAKSVEHAKSYKSEDILQNIKRDGLTYIDGMLYINGQNNHAHRGMKIGKIDKNGQFNIVWESDGIIDPNPYPKFKSKQFWKDIQQKYYKQWDSSWENSGGANE